MRLISSCSTYTEILDKFPAILQYILSNMSRKMIQLCLKTHCSFLFLFIFSLHLLPLLAHSLSFDIPTFVPGATDMLYEGDATPSNGSIELNTISSIARLGSASYANAVRLWDSSTRTLADFSTHFSFTIFNVSSFFSDGFAFFLAPVDYTSPPNSLGGYLGLFNSTGSQYPIVAVEFDSNVNFWDPRMEHVGINTGSIISAKYSPWDVFSMIGKEASVWITYNATTKDLSVFWTYDTNPVFMGNSSFSYSIDLMEVLPEWVRIGFSATTGQTVQRNVIHSWQFNSSLDSVGEFQSKKEEKRETALLIIGVVSFSILMLGVAVSYFVVKWRRAKNASRNLKTGRVIVDSPVYLEMGSFPKRFSYQELVMATNNFADHMRLGSGGSGNVYKGFLNDLGRLVAVKRIFAESTNSEKIFINEVKIISRLFHRNLVQFIGWCHEQGKFLLVYEYMPYGSLDAHIFGNKKHISWDVRYRIASNLASAIHYLHEDAEKCVLHRDIKSANILLDTDFNVKLADFGVAKLIDPQLRTQMTGLVGTYGYLAPEYVSEGRATKESDIYSFGIVVLEIACGRRTYHDGEFHVPLLKWVWQLYLAENILSAADERLDMEFDDEEMECLLKVGLWCTHPKDKERPKAGQVIKVLRFEAPLPELPNDMHDLIFSSSPPQPAQMNNSGAAFMTSSLDDHGR